jgi:hypothetical protein
MSNFKFDPKEHKYTLNDKPLLGVTSVLKSWGDPSGLIHWAWKLGKEGKDYRETRDEAGSHGTNVHKEIEDWIQGMIAGAEQGFLTPPPDQVLEFTSWAVDNAVKFLDCEKKMYSEKLWLAGTCDFIAEIDGKRFVGDVKTGNSIYPNAFYQCAAYALMMEEHEEPFDGTIVVHIPKKGGLTEYKRYDLETDKKAFLGILDAYKADATFSL